jgi:hypothetical protein
MHMMSAFHAFCTSWPYAVHFSHYCCPLLHEFFHNYAILFPEKSYIYRCVHQMLSYTSYMCTLLYFPRSPLHSLTCHFLTVLVTSALYCTFPEVLCTASHAIFSQYWLLVHSTVLSQKSFAQPHMPFSYSTGY